MRLRMKLKRPTYMCMCIVHGPYDDVYYVCIVPDHVYHCPSGGDGGCGGMYVSRT